MGPTCSLSWSVTRFLALKLRCDFEHRPGTINAARLGRAIEIPNSIEDQGGAGIEPVFAVLVEAMQHFLRPAPACLARQLEHRTPAVSAAIGRGAVEIAGGIEESKTRLALGPDPSLPLKACSTFSVQLPPILGVNLKTVPSL
jgi:hypothetical protein